MRRKRKSKHIGRTVIILLLALVLLFICLYFGIKNFNKALDPENKVYFSITIPAGSSTTKIGTILQENELISSGLVFKLKSKFNKLDGKFQAGEYELSPSMTMEEIMTELQSAKSTQIRITIPEGWTMSQLAEYFVNKGIAKNTAEFFTACEDEYDYSFLPKTGCKVKDISAKANRLEGFLYPETYFVDVNANLHQIIDTLLSQFQKNFTDDLIKKIPNGYSIKDIITLASLIEEECGDDADRAKISGVFWNRLNKPMRLQSDVTIWYTTDTWPKDHAHYATEYNTYYIDGLPAGPICSPSIKSIKAALSPEKHNYYYFVLIGDGSGLCNFATTYEEHQKNVEIWKKNSNN